MNPLMPIASAELGRQPRMWTGNRKFSYENSLIRIRTTAILSFLLLCGPAWAASFRYEDFKKRIDDGGITTIEGALGVLPQEFLRHQTYLKKPQGKQQGSPEAPRSMIFGEDASFIVSFNGDPKDEGYHSLEVAQFYPETNELELREITFPKPGEKGMVEFSDPNPKQCTTCHGSPPTWFWTKYPSWKVAYGSKEDLIIDPTSLGSEKFPEEAKEFADYVKFIGTRNDHPRYSQALPKGATELNPFFPYVKFAPKNMEQYDSKIKTSNDSSNMPNMRLSSFLYRYNARRLATQMKGHPLGKLISALFAYRHYQCFHWKTAPALLTEILATVKKFGKEIKPPANVIKDGRQTVDDALAELMKRAGVKRHSDLSLECEHRDKPFVRTQFYARGSPEGAGISELDLLKGAMISDIQSSVPFLKHENDLLEDFAKSYTGSRIEEKYAKMLDKVQRSPKSIMGFEKKIRGADRWRDRLKEGELVKKELCDDVEKFLKAELTSAGKLSQEKLILLESRPQNRPRH